MSGSKPGNLAGPARFPLRGHRTAAALPKRCAYARAAFTNEYCKRRSVIATAFCQLSLQETSRLAFGNSLCPASNGSFPQVRPRRLTAEGRPFLLRKGIDNAYVHALRRHFDVLDLSAPFSQRQRSKTLERCSPTAFLQSSGSCTRSLLFHNLYGN